MNPARVGAVLQWGALVVLVAGLGAGALVWRAQDQRDRENAGQVSTCLAPLESRKQMREIEVNYGKFGVLVEKAEALLHGKALAKTIAASSVAAAGALFLLASRLRSEA